MYSRRSLSKTLAQLDLSLISLARSRAMLCPPCFIKSLSFCRPLRPIPMLEARYATILIILATPLLSSRRIPRKLTPVLLDPLRPLLVEIGMFAPETPLLYKSFIILCLNVGRVLTQLCDGA